MTAMSARVLAISSSVRDTFTIPDGKETQDRNLVVSARATAFAPSNSPRGPVCLGNLTAHLRMAWDKFERRHRHAVPCPLV